MIRYRRGFFLPENLCYFRGGVWLQCGPLSVLCGFASAALKWWAQKEPRSHAGEMTTFMTNNAAFTGVSVLIGFLVIFRTQQAYARFWESCNLLKSMQSEFFNTASNMVAFVRAPDPERIATDPKVNEFVNLLIRLVSILHAVCLMKLHHHGKHHPDDLFPARVIDSNGLSELALKSIEHEECKVELLVQWIQSVTVDSINEKICVIPPPILSRTFQNLSNGVAAFYDATRIAEIPYPFPYMQTTELLLMLLYCITPLVMTNFVDLPIWAFVFSFCNMFILLSLHFVACEIEDPFGTDPNDIDLLGMQEEMNKRLYMLLKPATHKAPEISSDLRAEIFKHATNGRRVSQICVVDFESLCHELPVELGVDTTLSRNSFRRPRPPPKALKTKSNSSVGQMNNSASQADKVSSKGSEAARQASSGGTEAAKETNSAEARAMLLHRPTVERQSVPQQGPPSPELAPALRLDVQQQSAQPPQREELPQRSPRPARPNAMQLAAAKRAEPLPQGNSPREQRNVTYPGSGAARSGAGGKQDLRERMPSPSPIPPDRGRRPLDRE